MEGRGSARRMWLSWIRSASTAAEGVLQTPVATREHRSGEAADRGAEITSCARLSSMAGGTTCATQSLRFDLNPLLCLELRNEADAHAKRILGFLRAITEHGGTDGLTLINFREPKCRGRSLSCRPNTP